MKWINVKEVKPEPGTIVVVWLPRLKEPACVRVEKDKMDTLFKELVEVDRFDYSREGPVSHWLPLPEPPKEENEQTSTL